MIHLMDDCGWVDSFNLAKTHAFYTFMAKLKYGSDWPKR
jgi:hypothetical protein